MDIKYIDSEIETIDLQIKSLHDKIGFLELKKNKIRAMKDFVDALDTDDRQALYEILEEESRNGNLGWSR